jgi:putative MATE family efflux protein
MVQKHSPLLLGTEKLGKLLAQYAIPAIIAMTAASLYNIADSIFIGHGVGPLAISGLAITFPIMNMAAAFGSLVGAGAATLLSLKLGQKDYESANRVLGNVVVLNMIIGIAFTVVCFLVLDPILYFFGASEQTIAYAREYMEVILLGNVVTHMYLGLNAVLRSAGFPKLSMYATLASVVINCILNPLFIFGFGWGIAGSAWATVISQLISLIYQFIHFSRNDRLIRFRRGIYTLRGELVRGILAIGLSPFLMNLCSSLVVILINRGLKEYGGDLAIGAYGIVNRLSALFVMIIMGLNQGMQPIAGYNFGAKLYPRVLEVTKLTIRLGIGIASVGFLLAQFIPETMAGIFTTDPELTAIAVKGLHIVFAAFPIAGFQMVATNFFLSIGMPRKSIFLSLTRQLIFLVPFLLVLPTFWETTGVWISIPFADLSAAALTWFVLMNQFKKFGKYS